MTHKSDKYRILILSPLARSLWNADEKRMLSSASSEVVFIEKPQPLSKISQLFDGKTPTILALDPDFCNWTVSDKLIARMKNIHTVCLQTTSYSWLNTKLLHDMHIRTTNIRNYATEAVAEWALLMMQSLARKIPLVAKAHWTEDYSKFEGIELKGKTAGIIGLGHIGTRIAEMCQGLGMNVCYWSRSKRDSRFTYTPLPKLMKNSNVVFLTLAKNNDTMTILTDSLLTSMKPSSIFVSVVHEIYNHALLVSRIAKGDLYGYGFEQNNGGVFDNYKGNIWAGPSLAWVTDAAKKRNAQIWLENIMNATRDMYPNLISH